MAKEREKQKVKATMATAESLRRRHVQIPGLRESATTVGNGSQSERKLRTQENATCQNSQSQSSCGKRSCTGGKGKGKGKGKRGINSAGQHEGKPDQEANDVEISSLAAAAAKYIIPDDAGNNWVR